MELAQLLRQDEEGVIPIPLSRDGSNVITSVGSEGVTSTSSLQGSSILTASLSAPSVTAVVSRVSSAVGSLVTPAPRIIQRENGERVVMQAVEEILTPEQEERSQRKAELLARRMKRRTKAKRDDDFVDDMWTE